MKIFINDTRQGDMRRAGMSVFRLKSDFRFFENKENLHKIDQNVVKT